MTSLNEKRAHVARAKKTRRHTCHWMGCTKQCPPAMWGCKEHWFKLPRHLRDAIWRAYQPGQEERLDPSDEYMRVAELVQKWIAENGGGA
jgi:hypothetical protein